MSTCKACGAPIIWIATPAGKNMPCDEGIIPYWDDPNGKEQLMLQTGELVRCSTEPRTDVRASGCGRVPHWVTCPNADRFRRRGKK